MDAPAGGGFMKVWKDGKPWDGKLEPRPPLTFDELRRDVMSPHASQRPSYIKKMLHTIPPKPVVERNPFICDLVAGKVVLDVGASGQLHQDIRAVSPQVYGLDLSPDSDDITAIDLDMIGITLPFHPDVQAIVAGEIIEHLTNPGYLLSRLHSTYVGVPLVVTVPNAFSQAAAQHIARGLENVNRDHVAWYSPKTIEWLLARHGYHMKDWAWYNGPPLTAEGIVAVAE